MTFIVRVSRNESGRIAGVVERVRTGEKEQVDRLEVSANPPSGVNGTPGLNGVGGGAGLGL
jgi:hypothetical protein